MKHQPLALAFASLLIIGCNGGSSDSPATTSTSASSNFSRALPVQVQSSYFPLASGLTYIYEPEEDSEDEEMMELEFTYTKKVISDVVTVAVIEREYEDDELVDMSTGWYAQDTNGAIWEFGETSVEYEDGVVVDEESWQDGVDGASARQVMSGIPAVGDTFTHTEDDETETATVSSITASLSLEIGDYDDVVVIDETSSNESGTDQFFFAANVGLVQFTESEDELTFVLDEIESTVAMNLDAVEEALPVASTEYGEFDDVGFEYEYNSDEDLAELIIEIESETAIEELMIWDPEGELILELEADDLEDTGLSDIIIESGEADTDTVEDEFEEGTYTFFAETTDDEMLFGEAVLSHALTAATTIAICDTSVDKDSGVISWSAVTDAESYEVEIENDDLDIDIALEVPASVTSFTLPAGVLEGGEEYDISVAAENEEGNINSAECSFETD